MTTPCLTPLVRNSHSTTQLDLILITASAVTSLILSFMPTSLHISLARHPHRTLLTVSIAFCAACSALALLAASLILGWTRSISIDALSTVMFAMVAALIRIPFVLDVTRILFRTLRRPSLCVPASKFRYVRYGKECRAELGNAEFWRDNFEGRCHQHHCQVRMYIRCLPMKTTLSYVDENLSCFRFKSPNKYVRYGWGFEASLTGVVKSSLNPGLNPVKELQQTQWHGIRVGHSDRLVMLRDQDDGITAWWWKSVASGSHFAMQPSKLMLSEDVQVLNALALISDMISIGQLVTMNRTAYLADLWINDHSIRAAKSAQAGLVCCKILKELGLHSWYDHTEMDMRNMKIESLDKLTLTRKAFGMLFLILADKTNVFRETILPRCMGDGRKKKRRKSGQDVLDVIVEFSNACIEEFDRICKREVDEWLMDWGCKKVSLQRREDDIKEQLRIQHGLV